jgi:cephalosporin hydroxylase
VGSGSTNILEFGSGTGASALWFADLLRLFRIDGHVHSVDLRRPGLEYPGVTFIEGDCRQIETVFKGVAFNRMASPWLVVEDIHVNTLAVLRLFSQSARPADYFVVEDSGRKRADLDGFDREFGAAFRVDTRYTDFFSRNTTCYADSIFVRV